jgi:hypothetical protein
VFTHQRITNSDFWRDMLGRMIAFCHLLFNHEMDTDRSRVFQSQCELELVNMDVENHLAINLYRFKRE